MILLGRASESVVQAVCDPASCISLSRSLISPCLQHSSFSRLRSLSSHLPLNRNQIIHDILSPVDILFTPAALPYLISKQTKSYSHGSESIVESIMVRIPNDGAKTPAQLVQIMISLNENEARYSTNNTRPSRYLMILKPWPKDLDGWWTSVMKDQRLGVFFFI